MSVALARLRELIHQEKAAQDVDAVSTVIRQETLATIRDQSLRSALK